MVHFVCVIGMMGKSLTRRVSLVTIVFLQPGNLGGNLQKVPLVNQNIIEHITMVNRKHIFFSMFHFAAHLRSAHILWKIPLILLLSLSATPRQDAKNLPSDLEVFFWENCGGTLQMGAP